MEAVRRATEARKEPGKKKRAGVVELVDTTGLGSVFCGFKSHLQ